jgi:[acyl-carrier-protein] S-malonyltransferase
MEPAAEGLKQILRDVPIHPFTVGVITNVEADVNYSAERVKLLLVEQAVRPVRWEESVKKLADLNCHRVLEIGPGKVLKGLMRRIVPAMESDNFEDPQDLSRILTAWGQ